METKLDGKRMEKVRRSCGFLNGIDIAIEGTRGGLCLAWKEEVEVTLKSFSRSHIDVLVKEENIDIEWRFTGFYVSPYANSKIESWNLLRRLADDKSQPWLVSGDFNEVMYSFEKMGGSLREEWKMEAFRETLEECPLEDIGFSGAWFTWEIGNFAENNIRERLDRGIANEKWRLLFPTAYIRHLAHSMSDHCPLLLNTINLKDWASSIKKGQEGMKRKLAEELEMLLENERNEDTLAKIIDTRVQLNMEMDRDEIYWEQWARANWLKVGDKNTTFFHNRALARKKLNMLYRLELGGERKTTEENINDSLIATFTKEVFAALKEMGPTKAPGPDGFPALFFQRGDIANFCLGILNDDQSFGQLNLRNIMLIPKFKNPVNLANFRPISLCTVPYKIVAKTVANRFQRIIRKCIDEAQSAFVPRRLISGNVTGV
ncbi:reverse transcriptase [Gossypium australe]|uniref:Reverse transcriptase n=1 Tax=Gossypium australe TaxID=47621 RepID=A0A5B6X8S5_9ROSI|nr:reverse transcriptase [Gossypium australe]